MSRVEPWFAVHSGGAPAPLRQRAASYLAADRGAAPAEALAAAATAALAAVLTHPGDRSAALDLLAADALLTLALKARAEECPAALATFAGKLRARGGAGG